MEIYNNKVNPYFSVIVPIYKVERYLTKCIDSILGQTFHDFELILVDVGIGLTIVCYVASLFLHLILLTNWFYYIFCYDKYCFC